MKERRDTMVAPPAARCLREDDAATYVSLSVTAFRREWEAGRAPPPVKLTEGRQGWVIEALDAYLNRLVTASPKLVAWLRAHGLPAATVDRKRGGPHPLAAGAHEAVAEWDAACDGTRNAALS